MGSERTAEGAGVDVAALEAEIAALRRENGSLRAQIVALEGALMDQRVEATPSRMTTMRAAVAERADNERRRLLHAIIDHSPSVVFVKDPEGRYLLLNRHAERLYRKPRKELLGRTDADFFPPEAVRAMRERDEEAVRRDEPIQFEEAVEFADGTHHYVTIKFPILNSYGALMGVCGIATDITEQKRQEEERLLLREQVIAAQEETLRELSTPLVPIADGVVAMPIVGRVDQARAERIMSTLLDGIGHHGAHSVILDVTGVRTVDTNVASAIVSAARAARLLGARVVVTGVRPEVARTLLEIGTDLEGIVMRSNLQSGIAFALRR
ncbi:PAS domain-containing protein [Polyangium jinanense]|uniref:PAS domain-containing protein n=1 Tax=Polyangium jinanense TaxID=2829994 RepID=A0A9X4AW75_9BACT|nr:PAS domain-containing protein [Polyangium jinanense]MDC3957437.1 PAS domain-containing protein [Polyangium jinanense]MDC3985072.1 PAS domain-containing protein [Polyangium jinanense]